MRVHPCMCVYSCMRAKPSPSPLQECQAFCRSPLRRLTLPGGQRNRGVKSRILKGFGRGKQVFIGTLGRGKQDFKGLWARKVGFWKSFRA